MEEPLSVFGANYAMYVSAVRVYQNATGMYCMEFGRKKMNKIYSGSFICYLGC